MPERPTGTVTFLFTDIEGSTRLWQRAPEAMQAAVARHDALLRAAIGAHGGQVFSTSGDGVAAAFQAASGALEAAIEATGALDAQTWPAETPIRVRMGLHTGEAEERDGDYFGTTLNRAARLMAVGHGGQILVSATTEALVREGLRGGVTLADLGEHRLRDLADAVRVYEVRTPDSGGGFPPLRSLDAFPGNLPVQTSSFVGREREVKEIAAELLGARVVTLTGVGGVGKTRLALQVAAEVLAGFRDGVWLVELGGVVSGDAVLDAVAAAIGFVSGPTGGAGLAEHLRSRELLLILDNCEHLLAPVAGFVDTIVRTGASVRVLATSREGLGVAGEHLRAVPSLGLPDPSGTPESIENADAVRLFVERGREASSGFELDRDGLVAVAELCRRLDGIPLAIELAAARVPAFTPAEISAHLDRRFTLLSGGRRAAVGRHQTLRNAIQWSYELLDQTERSVLERLAVFAGGFDLEAAQAVAGGDAVDALDVLDIVARLVAKSLVVAEQRGGSTRYRLLETVRDFAWEQLRDADAVGRCHAEHFARFARAAGRGLQGPREADWRPRVEREVDNLRAGAAWAIAAGDAELALRPIADLAVLGDRIAPYGLLAESAARLDERHPLAPVALGAASFAAVLLGEIDLSGRLAEEALERAAVLEPSPEGLWARCRTDNAVCAAISLVFADRFQEFADRWLADARELGDPWCLCEVLTYRIGGVGLGLHPETGEEALVLARQLGAPSRIAIAAHLLAARFAEVDPSRVGPLLEEARRAAALSRNDWVDYSASNAEVMLHLATGDRTAALDAAIKALERSIEQRLSGHVVQFAAYFGCIAATLGDEEGAVVCALWAEERGLAVFTGGGHPLWSVLGQADLLAIRARMAEGEVQHLRGVASALDDRGVARYARERQARVSDAAG